MKAGKLSRYKGLYYIYGVILILALFLAFLLGKSNKESAENIRLKSRLTEIQSQLKKLTVTVVPTVTPTPQPTATPTLVPTTAVVLPTRKCDYNAAQLKAIFKMAGISQENQDAFFNAFTGDCFTVNKDNNSSSQNNNFNCTTRYLLGTAYTSCN